MAILCEGSQVEESAATVPGTLTYVTLAVPRPRLCAQRIGPIIGMIAGLVAMAICTGMASAQPSRWEFSNGFARWATVHTVHHKYGTTDTWARCTPPGLLRHRYVCRWHGTEEHGLGDYVDCTGVLVIRGSHARAFVYSVAEGEGCYAD